MGAMSGELLLPTEGYAVQPIPKGWAKPFIMDTHYAHRMPPISYAYGLFNNGEHIGVCTFGVPANNMLCVGVCGAEYKQNVIELNRLVLKNNRPNEASQLIGKSLRLLPNNWIVVSYADTAQNHSGVVYQATNWIFTGTTVERMEFNPNGKHSRHYEATDPHRVRSAKHRYVMFVGNRRWKKKALKNLKYPVQEYP
jgi:hypothetical protein